MVGWTARSRSGGLCLLRGVAHCGLVAKRTETRHDALCQFGQVRMVAKSLALVDVGNVYFDKWNGDPGKRIADRHAGVCIRTGIDDHEICAIEPRGLDPAKHCDQTIYRTIKYTIEPPTDETDRARAFRRMREDRAAQCRVLLERCNASGNPVCLAIDNAQDCTKPFLK